MIIEIKQSDSREEVEAKLQQMHDHVSKKEEERQEKEKKEKLKSLFGSIKLKEDPVVMQRRWRDEWWKGCGRYQCHALLSWWR